MSKNRKYTEREEAVVASDAQPARPMPEDDQRLAFAANVRQMLVETERGRRSERAKAVWQRRKQRAAQADAAGRNG